MRKTWIVAGIWLAGAVFIGSGKLNDVLSVENSDNMSVVHAANTSKSSSELQKEIDEKNKKTESLEAEKKALAKDIDALENKKGDVVSYIEELDDKLNALSGKISENEASIATTKKEIKKLRKEKKEAEEKKGIQYDSMLKRIKYMYENGSDGYLELLFESDSLSELFNRAEYVTKVSNYDNHLLGEYQKTCDTITTSQTKLEGELSNLTTLKKSLNLKKDSVDTIMDKKSSELATYQVSIDDKSDNIDSTNSQLAKQEEELEALMAAQRKKFEQEEAAKKAAAKKKAAKATATPSKKNNQSSSSNNASSNSTQNNTSSTVSAAGFRWPLNVSGRISSYFGYRVSPTAGASSYHKGIDISVPVGTAIVASKAGTVVTSAYSSSAGNYIALSHGDGVYTYYMHCSSLSVSVGTTVSQGQQIALSGNTGVSTGPHLHFAVYAGGAYVNPLNYVSQK